MSPNLKTLLDLQLSIIPMWPAYFNVEEDRYICSCPRKSYCPSPGKHCILPTWKDLPIPPNTPETISQMENSKCGFAIVPDDIPNTNYQLVIIDVDLPALKDDFVKAIPPTLTVVTRTGGLHYYVKVPKSQEIKILSSGYVDIRTKNSYALIPNTQGYRFSPLSTDSITTLPSLPQIPTRPNTSSPNSSKSLSGIYTPYDSYITSDGLVGVGGRDAFVFHELITLCNAGHSLDSLLQHADEIYQALDQPPKDPYTLSAIRDKAYYVYDRYHDPETEALRAAMDATYPPA